MPSTECGFADDPNDATAPSGSNLLTLNGPTLLVDIGFDPSFKPGVVSVPIAGRSGVMALVDTGASQSCIDNLLAAAINLPIVDRRPIGGVGGTHMANMYLAQIYVPSLKRTVYGAFAGVGLVAGGQVHQALIGRTFLQYFKMVYDGPSGRVTISQPDPVAPPPTTIPGLPPGLP